MLRTDAKRLPSGEDEAPQESDLTRRSRRLGRLVVVSNRVAVPGARDGAGGLAVGVHDALKEHGGLWFGWSGHQSARPSQKPAIRRRGGVTYATVDLSGPERAAYYNGYANRTLWPLFHYRIDLAAFDRAYYDAYRRVNARFARGLHPLLKRSDVVWVQDYHLIPLCDELRGLGFGGPVGFFLHIPFPAPQLFAALPNHTQLMHHLLAYDVVGLQTPSDVDAFLGSAREFGARTRGDHVHFEGRHVRVIAVPIGIDVDEFHALAESAPATAQMRRQLSGVGLRKFLVGVDRLDYTKGLPTGMAAMKQLLADHREHLGHVTMLQIAAPTREDVPEYVQIRQELEAAMGNINGTFAELGWEPVRYINKSFSRATLAGIYRASDVGLVTPLRDGMNLVAKEYIAAQDAEDPGVLVLSRFAGAAAQMDAALVVNPYDMQALAGAMQRALTMPLEERKKRYQSLLRGLRKQDLAWWRNTFLRTLSGSRR